MTVSNFITFDRSLPIFVRLVSERLGNPVLSNAIFLRDAFGRLSLVVDESVKRELPPDFGSEVKSVLGRYVDESDLVVVTPGQLFDESLRSKEGAMRLHLVDSGKAYDVWTVDRRAVGTDWLTAPAIDRAIPPRVVFSSLKGGVGRTTALCVAAAHLASKGKRVLAIDLDIEAPGLGNMLLDRGTLPQFGLLDYLVERGLGEVPDEFLIDVVGPSWLAKGRGRIDIVPVIGKASEESPENVVAKIARAYISSPGEVEEVGSFAAFVREFIGRLTAGERYDVVLIDARSGLHETTASALLGLGGDVYLFGASQPQTFAGFSLLIANVGLRAPAPSAFWGRFRVVQSKASSLSPDAEFVSSVKGLLNQLVFHVSEPQPDLDGLMSEFDVTWDDSMDDNVMDQVLDSALDAVPFISIREEEDFRHFDPLASPNLLDEENYLSAFSALLSDIESLVGLSSEEGA